MLILYVVIVTSYQTKKSIHMFYADFICGYCYQLPADIMWVIASPTFTENCNFSLSLKYVI